MQAGEDRNERRRGVVAADLAALCRTAEVNQDVVIGICRAGRIEVVVCVALYRMSHHSLHVVLADGLVEREEVVPYDAVLLVVLLIAVIVVAIIVATVEPLVGQCRILCVESGAELQEVEDVILKEARRIDVLGIAVARVEKLDKWVLDIIVDGVDGAVFVVCRIVGTHVDDLADHVVLVVCTARGDVHVHAELQLVGDERFKVESSAECAGVAAFHDAVLVAVADRGIVGCFGRSAAYGDVIVLYGCVLCHHVPIVVRAVIVGIGQPHVVDVAHVPLAGAYQVELVDVHVLLVEIGERALTVRFQKVRLLRVCLILL